MTILRKTLLVVTIATLTAGAHAGTLLIDRGLPTANLNNAAGANRSNVAWAQTPDAMGTWVVGDTFKNSSAFNYHIDNIRVWLTGAYDAGSLRLLGGLGGSATFATLSTSAATSGVTYAGGADYETTSGSFIPLTQVDFAVSGLTLGAGDTYDFFVQGTRSSGATPYVFLHASNAGLSDSPQQGSDGLMLQGVVSGGTVSSVTSWDSAAPGGGWDKPSDINVQVFGTVPDAGSTVLLIGLALTGLGLVRRRFAV